MDKHWNATTNSMHRYAEIQYFKCMRDIYLYLFAQWCQMYCSNNCKTVWAPVTHTNSKKLLRKPNVFRFNWSLRTTNDNIMSLCRYLYMLLYTKFVHSIHRYSSTCFSTINENCMRFFYSSFYFAIAENILVDLYELFFLLFSVKNTDRNFHVNEILVQESFRIEIRYPTVIQKFFIYKEFVAFLNMHQRKA